MSYIKCQASQKNPFPRDAPKKKKQLQYIKHIHIVYALCAVSAHILTTKLTKTLTTSYLVSLYASLLVESNYKTSQTMPKSLCIAMNRILYTARSFVGSVVHSIRSKLNSVFCIGLMVACIKWHHTESTKCVNRSILSGARNNELVKQRHLFSFLTVRFAREQSENERVKSSEKAKRG